MNDENGRWHHYVVYQNAKDYPDKFVVRRWSIIEGHEFPVPDKDPIAVVDLYRETVKHIPPGLVRIARDPTDDKCIVETWM